jgi:predicted RecA/RadA family phage recombinase
MAYEASYYQPGESLDYTPGSATTAGTVLQLADGRAAVPANDIAASAKGSLTISGVFKIAAATGTTWSDKALLYWDSSASQAVTKSLALDGDADFYLGRAVGAKASGPTYGYVELNAPLPVLDPIVYEFDCDGDNGDTSDHVLIPAEQNPNGLLILGVYAVVTEQMAGSSEDQGIVTVYDQSNNTICTLTPTNAAADAVGDIIKGYAAGAATTGDAAKTVAAGEYVDAKVTQQTSGGTPAGKYKVYIQAVPLK